MDPSESASSVRPQSTAIETAASADDEAAQAGLVSTEAPRPELFLAVDRELRIVAVNDAMLRCLACTEQEVAGRPLGDVLDAKLARLGLTAYAALSSGRQIVAEEWLASEPDATPGRYRFSFLPLAAGSQFALSCIGREAIDTAEIDSALIEATNRVQQRLGRDLHDTLGQELATTSMLLAGFERRIGDSVPELTAAAADIRDTVSQALQSMRAIARGLAPSGLEDNGLIRALAELADRCSQIGRTRFEFSAPKSLPPLPAGTLEHVYRFAQEAVANAVRHSQANAVAIHLAIEEPELVLSVDDNGAGFDPDQAAGQSGLGLRIMRHRAESLGGRFALDSGTGGTRIAMHVPLGAHVPRLA